MERARNATFLSVDRRIIHAFLDIAHTKKVVDITVRELCTQTFIDRTTFYRHFRGVWEILDRVIAGIEERMMRLVSAFDYDSYLRSPAEYISANFGSLFEDVETMRKAVRVDEVNSAFWSILRKMVDCVINSPTIPEAYRGTARLAVGASFYAEGLFFTYYAWLRGDIDCSAEELQELIIEHSMRSVIRPDAIESHNNKNE